MGVCFPRDTAYSENTATLVAVPVHRWTSAWGVLPPVIATNSIQWEYNQENIIYNT